MKSKQMWFYCECGAAWIVTSETAAISKLWYETHAGEGHAPTTAQVAARARARSERESYAEMRREGKGK